MDYNRIVLGNRVKQAILVSGKTQKELAEELEISPNSLTNYTKGKSTPSVELVYKIADICGVNVIWLLSGNGEMLTGKEVQIDSTGEYGSVENVFNQKIEELLSQNLQLKTQIINSENDYSLIMAKVENVVNRLDSYAEFLDEPRKKICMPFILKVVRDINQILERGSAGLQND